MDDSVTRVARTLGVPDVRVRCELAGAIRRSEPDAREVYGVINGRRFVARRVAEGADSIVALEARRQPWDGTRKRPPTTGGSEARPEVPRD